MPTAGELIGGFWDAVRPSGVVDAYAAGCGLVAAAAARPADPAVRGWTVRADQAVATYTAGGRAVVGYPRPGFDPAWVADSLADPSVVLCRGVDFTIDADNDLVVFDVDPLAAERAYPLWTDGTPVAAADLWCGVAGIRRPDPTPVPGSARALAAALAAACDSPAAGGFETVEAVFESAAGWRVVTDAAVYRLGPADLPGVAAGDALAPGDPVGSAWTLTRLGPAVPDAAVLPHVTTPAGFHQGATAGGITWYNASVPLVVDAPAGRTRARFRLGAQSQGDLDAFWAASHANGIAAGGTTLAQALDTRGPGHGDPDVNSLPPTVNPLVLLCRELLAGNAHLAVVAPARFGPEAATAAERARRVLTAAGPYTAVFEYEDAVPALTPYDPA